MAFYFVFDRARLALNHLFCNRVYFEDQNFLHKYFFIEVDLIPILNFTLITSQRNGLIARYPSSVNVNVIQDDLPCLDWCHLAVFVLDSSFALKEHFCFRFTWLLSLFSLFFHSAHNHCRMYNFVAKTFRHILWVFISIVWNFSGKSNIKCILQLLKQSQQFFSSPQHAVAPVIVGIFSSLCWYFADICYGSRLECKFMLVERTTIERSRLSLTLFQ